MAIVRIKLIRAYDCSINGIEGTNVPDMFRALTTPHNMEIKKSQEAVDKAVELAKEYAEKHPGESFMPCLSITAGRKPNGFDSKTSSSNPELRKWLLPKPKSK